MHPSDVRDLLCGPEMPGSVQIREVALRDGLQIEDKIPTADKLRLLEAIVATGVSRVEVTAFVSAKAIPALSDAERLVEELRIWPEVEWSALVASHRDATRAIAAGIRHIQYVISASDGHSTANVGFRTHEALSKLERIADEAHVADGTCDVIVATAWDCPFDGETPPERTVELVASAIERGADAICLADTIGTVTPRRLVALIRAVQRISAGADIGVHLHNTRGMGTVNAWAAMQAGIRHLDSSVGGLGGCPFAPGATGNIATEELVYLCNESGVETGMSLDVTLQAARLAEKSVGHTLPSALLKAGARRVDSHAV